MGTREAAENSFVDYPPRKIEKNRFSQSRDAEKIILVISRTRRREQRADAQLG